MATGEVKNATVEGTRLGFDRGVFLCGWVYLDYGGSGQGFGGYVLSNTTKDEHAGAYAEVWLTRVLSVLGVETWEDLAGTPCRVDAEHGRVHGIGHYLKDEWFYPQEEFDALGEAERPPVPT